jgi:hypothetical protein
LPSIRIDLSTTTQAPDGLSLTFANNIGANNTTVFGGPTGALLSLSSTASGQPRNFDVTINLSVPFLYNPSLGNLLLDVRNFGGGGTNVFDAEETLGDSVSRIVTSNSGVNSATADFGDSVGLVTQFTFVGVPEPSAMLLVGTSAASFWGVRLRRRARAVE